MSNSHGAAFASTQVIDDAAAAGPDATRGSDHVASFAALVMAPMSGGLWQHGDDEIDAWIGESFGWQRSLHIGMLRMCAEQVIRRVENSGMAVNIAVNRAADVLQVRGNMGQVAARALVHFAAAVCSYPRVLQALAAGEITDRQAKITCGLLDAVPEGLPGREQTIAQIEAHLLDAARVSRSTDKGPFAKAVVKVNTVLNPDGDPPAEDPERNEFSIARLLNGRYTLRGDLDAETAEQLLTAMSPLAAPRPEPDGTRDRRPAPLRRAEAVAEILRRYLCGLGPDGPDGPADPAAPAPAAAAPSGADPAAQPAEPAPDGTTRGTPDGSSADCEATDAPAGSGNSGSGAGGCCPACGTAPGAQHAPGEALPGGSTRPQITVHIRARDLAGRGATDAQLLALLRHGKIHDLFTQLRAGWTEHHGAMTARTLRRIACDAAVTPILLDSHGTPLDAGRTVRLATRAQRRALAARDGGCAFPGCDRPLSWTDAHHIVHWADGGPTNLDNLALLCTAHHRAVHNDGWDIAMSAHRRPVFRPPSRIDPYRRWIDTYGLATTEPAATSPGPDTPARPPARPGRPGDTDPPR